MTEQLQHAFEIARKLPQAAQNALAAHILAEIEERGWDKTVRKAEAQSPSREQTLQGLEIDETDEPEAPEFDCL